MLLKLVPEHSINLSSLKSCIKERATNIKKIIYDGKKLLYWEGLMQVNQHL